MTTTLGTLLELPWSDQADQLRGFSRKELEILWFELQDHAESFDRLNLAVFSILRDRYEAEGRKTAHAAM